MDWDEKHYFLLKKYGEIPYKIFKSFWWKRFFKPQLVISISMITLINPLNQQKQKQKKVVFCLFVVNGWWDDYPFFWNRMKSEDRKVSHYRGERSKL